MRARVVAALVGAAVLVVPAAPAAGAWGPSVPVSPAGLDVEAAAAVPTPSGGRVLGLWARLGADETRYGITAVSPGLAPGSFASFPDADVRWAVPTVDGDGHVAVAYTEGAPDGGDDAVHVATVAADGSAAAAVSTVGRGSFVDADVDDSGELAVVWSSGDPGGASTLRVSIRRGRDQAFEAPVEVGPTFDEPGSSWREVHVEALGGGAAVVTVASPLGGLRATVVRNGSVVATRALESPDRRVDDVTLDGAGGRVLATWAEEDASRQHGDAPRTLRMAIATSVSVGDPRTLGSGEMAADDLPAVVAVRGSKGLVAWSGTKYDALGAHGNGARTVDVDLSTGATSAPARVVSTLPSFSPAAGGTTSYEAPTAAALAADGRALLVLAFMHAAVRPAGASGFVDPTLVSCRGNVVLAASFDGGVPSVTWTDVNMSPAVRRVFVARDEASAGPTCPPARHGPSVTPSQPHVGEDTVFDDSAASDSDGAPTQWTWDMDGDGVFESDWADRPVVRRTFSETGRRQVHVRARVVDGRGTRETTGYTFDFEVVPRSDGAVQTTSPFGGPARFGPPVVPVRASPARTHVLRSSVAVASRISSRSLAAHGVAVRLSSSMRGRVRASTTASRYRAASASRSVAAGRTVTVRLRPRRLRGGCRGRTTALRTRVVLPGGDVVHRTTTVRCR